MKSIAFINQKDGVGKTTSAFNIAVGLARQRKKILIIDMDPQAKLTQYLGLLDHQLNIYELLKKVIADKEKAKGDVIEGMLPIKVDKVGLNQLFIIPGSIQLNELEEIDIENKLLIFKNALDLIENFDYVLVDCPTNYLTFVALTVLSAIQEVYIPVEPNFIALQGLHNIFNSLKDIHDINPKIQIGGIFINKYKNTETADYIDYLKILFPNVVFSSMIRQDESLIQAMLFGKDIFKHDNNSDAAKDFESLCKEINSKNMTMAV